MNYLSIDYGLHHIGLAIALDTPLAEPLSTFQPQSSQHALDTLIRIIEQYHINHLIVGLPSGEVKPAVEQFGQKLQTVTQLPVTFVDESHTSKQAQFLGRQAGKNKLKIKQQEHQLAAAVILQTYLDSQN